MCGQMGVRRMAGMSGWTKEPPADREYAVEPEVMQSALVKDHVVYVLTSWGAEDAAICLHNGQELVVPI